jgi:outer membrane protein assembly factor BamA
VIYLFYTISKGKIINLDVILLKKKLTYFIVLMVALKLPYIAQTTYHLNMMNTDSCSDFNKVDYNKRFNDKSLIDKEINRVYRLFVRDGFIAASIDSVKRDSCNYVAYIHVGKKYQWINLFCDKKDRPIISKLGYGERFFNNKVFKYSELSVFLEKIIFYYENIGYPFVHVKLDSLQFDKNTIQANLVVEKNIYVKLDSLVIEGRTTINQKFLSRYLGIKNGMPYNAELFSSVSKKINQLPFLIEKKSPILKLTDKQNKLFVFLEKRNASQFDGIVGILPGDNAKTVFTGDLKIKLVNSILKNGETLDVNWRRLQTQTQDLKVAVSYPYIGGWPVGVDYQIKLYKKDTTFLDVNNGLGLNYYFNGFNHLKVIYKQRHANLISTTGLSNNLVLPEYADVNTSSYGLGFLFEKYDYRFNPRTGLGITFQGSAGTRQIHKNPKINETAYSNVVLKSNQYQIEGSFVSYMNVYKNHVFKLGGQLGSVFGNTLFKNELFRIGGLKTLRGFDEESIYASAYIIPTLEYRFLFEKNSNLFIFAEGAWYENSVNMYNNDTPISFGTGINFETKAGIFNLSYAIGKQQGDFFDLRIGKIHAGLTALF